MLNIVLFEPEIPQNTGNIARTCVGYDATLHMIRPYGFIFNKQNKELVRSGVDYWDHLKVIEYNSWDDFIKKNQPEQIYFLTRYGKYTPSTMKIDKQKETYIVFGKESTGIDKQILKENVEKTIRIPTSKNVRSLNVSNCVAILAYEYSRQNNYDDLEIEEPHKKNILF
ncbi:MAG: tRNA (cytidine(34)-2'-O)-methyltransferase [Mycoplasmataceae bacterium]|nr:tRNA (cytidine(34)-2'-O)-methyltransferase [Mycoplasmataceae bacterium]